MTNPKPINDPFEDAKCAKCPECGKLVIPVHSWYSNQAREVGAVVRWHCLGCGTDFDADDFYYDDETAGYSKRGRP